MMLDGCEGGGCWGSWGGGLDMVVGMGVLVFFFFFSFLIFVYFCALGLSCSIQDL